MKEIDKQIIQNLEKYCTTEGSVDEDGTWLLIIEDDEQLLINDYDRLKKAVKSVTRDAAKNLINFKFKEYIEFVFTRGKIFVGQKEFDKNETNLKLRNLDDIIYPEKRDRISLGWKDAVDAMFKGALEVCEDKKLFKILEQKYTYFQSAMVGLKNNNSIYNMFGVKAFNRECDHSICAEYWRKCNNKIFLKLKEILSDDCNKVCLFYKKGVVEVQDNEEIKEGLFAKPLQFTKTYGEKLGGKPYKYCWTQLKNVGTEEEKFPQCIELPHLVNLYDIENKRFTLKNVVYCRVRPWGIYISDATQIRLMTGMKEILYDDKYNDDEKQLDVGSEYKPLSSYNLNKEIAEEPESKKFKLEI